MHSFHRLLQLRCFRLTQVTVTHLSCRRHEAFVEAENISHPVIIEMFCGTARVTACLKAIGLRDSFGVDHIKSRAVSTLKIADLTTKHGQDVFLKWLESPLVQGIFIAPPCGTCSLARCIKLRDEKARPIPGPAPLRSEKFPEGLPNLSPRNRLRVSLANKLYEFVGRVIKIAHKKGLIIAVENPRSSLLGHQVVASVWSANAVYCTPSMRIWVRTPKMDCRGT